MDWYIAHFLEIHAYVELFCVITVALFGISILIEMIVDFIKKKK